MSVQYPDGLVLTEAQHLAISAVNCDPSSGHYEPRGREMAENFHNFNEAEAAEKIAAAEAAAADPPDATPDGTWTVAQIDAYAAEHDIPDYPSAGNKADKLAAITAAYAAA